MNKPTDRQAVYLHAQALGDLKPAVTLGKGYPEKLPLKIGGEQKEVPCAYFWKDAIAAGEYVHPATKQSLSVDGKRIDGWVERFNQMRGVGIDIPTPADHSSKAEDNLGFVLEARRNGDRLQLLHQVIGEDAALTALRNRCSLCIDPDYTDEKGRNWGDCFTHCAFTPVPVIAGMGSFVPFAASRGQQSETPIFYLSAETRNPNMDFKALREALGAAADVPDDKLPELAAKKIGDLNKDGQTALARAVTAETKVTELSRTPNPPDPEVMRDRHENAVEKIQLSVALGDMPATFAKRVAEKLGTPEKPNTFMLSRQTELGDRPLSFILDLFKDAKLGIATGARTGVQHLSRQTPGDETGAAKEVDPKDIEARARRVSPRPIAAAAK